MKRNYLKASLLVLSISSFSFINAQTKSQRETIISTYDSAKLNFLKNKLTKAKELEMQFALKMAKRNNWPIKKYNQDGSFSELQRVSKNGKPYYYVLDNQDAAVSTRANFLNSGGGLGLNLDGQNMTAAVWDGGPTRPTHQEYNNRITITDDNNALDGNSFHACHVTGTIAASGVVQASKGMAPLASVNTFDWNNDEIEAFTQAANGLLLSNHSYGVPLNNDPSIAGKYGFSAQQWDEIVYNAPYYLPVFSAGNDGNNNNPNSTTAGFDKLMTNKVAKNNLVIANAQDANINANGDLISVFINTGSSEGPTDDFRIKPDISGNGTGLYSTYDNSDSAYNSISGTSMAAPNVTGTLLLIQQHYNNINGEFMRASTLKGLATHTSDDAGILGPDAVFGWGLLNGKAAVEAIDENGLASVIEENTLLQGETYSFDIVSDGSSPFLASITWTDVPGLVNTGGINDATPALINDLDIRVTDPNSVIFYPWRLTNNPNQIASRNGDNTVDNVERINIDSPISGIYTVTVSHKGVLNDGPQNFSLIVTGASSKFAIIPLNNRQTVCSNQDVTYDFDFTQLGSGTTNFSVSEIPVGLNVVLSENSLSNNGSFTATVTGVSNLSPGDYEFSIIGDNGNETEIKKMSFTVYSAAVNPINLLSPLDGSYDGGISQSFTWDSSVNAESYDFELASDPSFNTILFSGNVLEPQYQVPNLNDQSVYYWKVKVVNRCGESAFSEIFNFQVGTEDCTTNVYSTSNIITIDGTDNSGAGYGAGWSKSIINVPDNIQISNVFVDIDITHPWVEDLVAYVESPVSFNQLIANQCGDSDNIDATFSDNGTALVCGANPAISGNLQPVTGFVDNFYGINSQGEWSLTTQDTYPTADDGTINNWQLSICTIEEITTLPSFVNNGFEVPTNSIYNANSSDIDASTNSELPADQIYTITQNVNIGLLKLNNVDLSLGDTFSQDDINNNRISYTNSVINNATDFFTVDISNAVSGWLPNQVVPININESLGVINTQADSLGIWPNPVSSDEFTISFNGKGKSNTFVKIFDLQGRLVLKVSLKSRLGIVTQNISVANLYSGVYMINLSQGSLNVTKKLIIK
jgi:subtilisin-like proprotein convertase family protein